MGVWYLEKRRCRFYFRARLPADVAGLIGKSHVVLSLETDVPALAKMRAARFFSSFASFLETMRIRMECARDLDGRGEPQLEKLVGEAFALGQAYQARQEELKSECLATLSQLVAKFKQEMPLRGIFSHLNECPTYAPPVGILSPLSDGKPGAMDLGEHDLSSRFQTRQIQRVQPAALPVSPPWTTLRKAFLEDKPGLTEKTLWSYNQAFDAWEAIIGAKPVGDIKRPDVKAYADFLRDKENPRGGKLDHKTIQRSLGHIKTFMLWAGAAGHAVDDRLETVTGRDMTKEELLAGHRRRALTSAELALLFQSPFFTEPTTDGDVAAGWFLALAALTGARTAEIALAPAKLALCGDIYCLDLRKAGRKTSAAPRLVPLLPDLIKMGLLDWAKRQEDRGYSLVQPSAEPRTTAAWSKLLNRYLNSSVSDDAQVVLYSLRHSFRQMLRAGNIGDELANKIFGHSSGSVGSGYGRDLSPAEARLFIDHVKPSVSLDRLWQG